MNIAVIFAGGRGKRLNDNLDSLPKQYLKIDNKPILVHTLLHFQNHPEIDKIYLSVLPDFKDYTKELIRDYEIDKVANIVDGGSSAQESIYNALVAAADENPDDSIVLLHDGVRPVITKRVISDNIESVKKYGTAVTATPCYETIIVSNDAFCPKEVPFRRETFAAQAPQSFRLKEILDAHNLIRESDNGYKDIVDACTMFYTLGRETHLVQGNFGNIKVTTPQDVYILKGILNFIKDNNQNTNIFNPEKEVGINV